MRRIRVVHLAQCAGGVDRYLKMLLRYMDRERFEQSVVCSEDYSEEDYRGLADRFIHVRMQNALSAKADGRAVMEVRRLIKELKPEIVYCHSSKAGGIGRLACVGLPVKVVYNPHGWAFNMKGSWLKRTVYLVMEKLLAMVTDQFVVISNTEKISAIKKRVTAEREIRVIFNGVDVREMKSKSCIGVSRSSLGIAEDAYIIGMVGRISQQKAPDVFVDMAELVTGQIPNAHFIIVGDGDERSMIESKIVEKGLKGRFTITGWVADATPYIRLFDQAVLLSRWEGFGLVLAEYMVERKPIVATEVDAIPDLITDHDNGLLVPADDADGAAEAVMEIYNNHDMRKELVDKAEMRALAFFDVRRTAKEHERLFVKISERGG